MTWRAVVGFCLLALGSAQAQTADEAAGKSEYPRAPQNWLEIQIALARLDFSCGIIDGVPGPKSAAALRAFQGSRGLDVTGARDPDTLAALALDRPALAPVIISREDLAALQPLDPTWVGRSKQASLGYETALEMLAARGRASQALIRRLNPSADWSAVVAGMVVTLPDAERRTPRSAAARIRIRLAARELAVLDDGGETIAFFPVGIAARVDKRPVGELKVVEIVPHPDYTFDPELFPVSARAQNITEKLVLPPGPNNPVGVAWIGLNLTGYGIHGTPKPESVGQAESHGCFRLTNWDVETLLDLVWRDMPVDVEP